MVRGFDVVTVADQSADGLPQAVPVGLLGAFVQQDIRNQARVSLTLQVLRGDEAVGGDVSPISRQLLCLSQARLSMGETLIHQLLFLCHSCLLLCLSAITRASTGQPFRLYRSSIMFAWYLAFPWKSMKEYIFLKFRSSFCLRKMKI